MILTVPSRLRFFIFLNEQGVDAPDKTAYVGARGSDGESFSTDELVAGGSRQIIRFSFDELALRSYRGNQTGNRTIDLQAIMGIDISIPENQGKGKLVVHACRLY